jgi:hypothetical protein
MSNWAEIRKTFLTAFTLTVLVSAVGTQFVKLARADPIPNLYSIITIENPQNTTYNGNTITVNFSVDFLEFLNKFNYSYSLDGKEPKSIENMTTVSEAYVPINPGIYDVTLKGSFVLSNLSEGWHNVTIYQTWYSTENLEPFINSASLKFMIIQEPTPSPEPYPEEPFPTTWIVTAAVSVAVVGIGSLVYLKKVKKKE